MPTDLHSIVRITIPGLGHELQEIAALEDVFAIIDLVKGQLDPKGEQKTRYIGGMGVKDSALLDLVADAVTTIGGTAIVSTVDGAIDAKVIDCAGKVVIVHHTIDPVRFVIPAAIRDKVVCAVACDKRQAVSKLACLLADDVVAFPGGIGTVEAILRAIEEGHAVNVYQGDSAANDTFGPLRDFIYGMQSRGLYSDDGSAFMMPFTDRAHLVNNIVLIDRSTVKHPVSAEFLTNVAKTRTWLKTQSNKGKYSILGASSTRPFEEQLTSYRQFAGFVLAPGASDIPAVRRFFRILFDKLFNERGRYADKELLVDAAEWVDIFRPFLASLCESGFIKYVQDSTPAFVPYRIDELEQVLVARGLSIQPNLAQQVRNTNPSPRERTLYGDPNTLPLRLKQIHFLYSNPQIPILFSTTSEAKMADIQRVTERLGLENTVYSLRDFMQIRDDSPRSGRARLVPRDAYREMFFRDSEADKFIPVFDSPELERTNTEIAAEKLRMAAEGLGRFSVALARDDKFKQGAFLLTGDVALTIHPMSPQAGARHNGWGKLLQSGIKIVIPAESNHEAQLTLQMQHHEENISYRWVEDPQPASDTPCVRVGPNFDATLTAFPGIYVGRILDNIVKAHGKHAHGSGGRRQATAFQQWARQSGYDLNKDMGVTQFATASLCYIHPGAERFARYSASISAVTTSTYNMGGDVPAVEGVHGLDLFIADEQQIGSYSNAMASAFENLIKGLQIGMRSQHGIL